MENLMFEEITEEDAMNYNGGSWKGIFGTVASVFSGGTFLFGAVAMFIVPPAGAALMVVSAVVELEGIAVIMQDKEK